MRALRERRRRGLRKLRIEVSQEDLRQIARAGEGAASSDHDQQAQAVGLFLTDSLLRVNPPYRIRSDSVSRVTVPHDEVTLALRRHGDAPPCPSGSSVFRRPLGGQFGEHHAAVLDRDLELVIIEEDPVFIPTA
jgi:hypothetical protein